MIDKIRLAEKQILDHNFGKSLRRMNKTMSEMNIKVGNVQLNTTELIRMGNMENLNAIGNKIEKIILGSSEQLFRKFDQRLIKTGEYMVEVIFRRQQKILCYT
jgi:hypothetical protein